MIWLSQAKSDIAGGAGQLLQKKGLVKWLGIAVALAVVVAAGAVTLAIWVYGARKAAQVSQGQGSAVHIEAASVPAAFAVYQEMAVDVKPQIPPYRVADDLGNVTNRERFKFSGLAAPIDSLSVRDVDGDGRNELEVHEQRRPMLRSLSETDAGSGPGSVNPTIWRWDVWGFSRVM